MKKSIIYFALMLSALFVFPTTMQAQAEEEKPKQEEAPKQEEEPKKKKRSKFGSFLRKAGEVTTGINMTDEPFVVNPLSMAVDIEFVECVGDSSTGYVNLIFKAKNKTYAERMSFGGSLDGTVAFDKQGKQYKPHTSANTRVDAARGIWSEVRLEGKKDGGFENVPAGLPAMELLKIYCYIDADKRGHIEFRNIPIVWK